MSESIELIIALTALLGTIPGIIAAILTFRVAGKVKEQSNTLFETKENVKKIEIATNSMKDALVAATDAAAHAKGKVEGRAEVKAELGASALAVQTDKDRWE